jgi:hypothetical protein
MAAMATDTPQMRKARPTMTATVLTDASGHAMSATPAMIAMIPAIVQALSLRRALKA